MRIYITFFYLLNFLSHGRKYEINNPSIIRQCILKMAILTSIPSLLPIFLYIAYVDCSISDSIIILSAFLIFIFWYSFNWITFRKKKRHAMSEDVLHSIPGKPKSFLILIVILIVFVGIAGIGAELSHQNCHSN